MSNNNSSNGFGLGTILFLIFLVLKLTNYIDWSWWWVTSPLWIGAILLVTAIVLIEYFFKR
jgi:hypothetical protein